MEGILDGPLFYGVFCVVSFILGMVLYWGMKTEYGMKKKDFEANIVVIILLIAFSALSYVTATVIACGIIMTFLVCLSDSDDEEYLAFKERFLKATTINITKLLKKKIKKTNKTTYYIEDAKKKKCF